MNRSDTIGKVMDALRLAQLEFDSVLKNATNPLYGSQYAELSGVIKATQPALAKYGLVISQLATSDLSIKGAGVETILAHESGEFISEKFLLPAEGYGKDRKPRYDAQTAAGATTYARRYGYLAIIGAAAQDDDGNAVVTGSTDYPDEAPDFREAAHATPRAPKPSPYQDTPLPERADARPTQVPAPKVPQEAPTVAEQPVFDMLTGQTRPSAYTTHGAGNPAPVPDVMPYSDFKGITEVITEEVAAQNKTPEHGDAYEGADDDGTLPTEEELKTYREQFHVLGDDLTAKGKLKSSKGLPVNRKLLVFLLSITKADDAKNITKVQWDDFFARVAAAKALEAGLVGIGKLVNKANGIEK